MTGHAPQRWVSDVETRKRDVWSLLKNADSCAAVECWVQKVEDGAQKKTVNNTPGEF